MKRTGVCGLRCYTAAFLLYVPDDIAGADCRGFDATASVGLIVSATASKKHTCCHCDDCNAQSMHSMGARCAAARCCQPVAGQGMLQAC